MSRKELLCGGIFYLGKVTWRLYEPVRIVTNYAMDLLHNKRFYLFPKDLLDHLFRRLFHGDSNTVTVGIGKSCE